MRTKAQRSFLVLVFAATVAWPCAGCSGDKRKSTASGAGGASPDLVLMLTCRGSSQMIRVPVDPEDPLPGLLKVAKLIRQECKPVPGATPEKPVELGVLSAEIGPFVSNLPEATLGASRPRATGSLGDGASMKIGVTFRTVHLVQTGDNRFAWGLWDPNRTRTSWGDKFHEGWFASPGDASQWVGGYFAEAYEWYRISLAVFHDRTGEEAASQMEKDLRATRSARAEKLTRAIRDQSDP